MVVGKAEEVNIEEEEYCFYVSPQNRTKPKVLNSGKMYRTSPTKN